MTNRRALPGVTAAAALLAAATVATLALGAGTAAADPTTPTVPPPQEPITLTAEQSEWICTERIPRALGRIDRSTARITGDAATRGSSAWARQRAAEAGAAGRPAVAEAFERFAARRPLHLDRLAEVRERLEAFATEHCAP